MRYIVVVTNRRGRIIKKYKFDNFNDVINKCDELELKHNSNNIELIDTNQHIYC